MRARLVVSVHDVAPGSAAQSRAWLTELDQRGIPSSLLVIPGPWRAGALAADLEFADYLRGRVTAGHEIVQHGWRHCAGADRTGWRCVTERALARGAGEFAAVSRQAATLRLRAGRAVLAEAGLATDAFTAPGWLHSPGALAALRAQGYRYTTTHAGVLDLRTGYRMTGPAFSHRPGGAGEALAAKLLLNGARAIARLGGLVRIALHPDDLSRAALRSATLTAIDDCLDAGAVATTYGALLDAATRSVAA